MSAITIARATSPTHDVRALVGELEAGLSVDYTPAQTHGLPLSALFEPHIRFFVASRDGVAVGCGGVALFTDFAEVKRMYVREAERGRGTAEALLARIEVEAREAGLRILRLETGHRLFAAMRFYERAGFRRCEVFGAYATMTAEAIETSVFFEKQLDALP
jgi:putative acetyltransferase